MARKGRTWRRMDFDQAVELVSGALESYLEEHDLQGHPGEGDSAELAEIARWAWARSYTWRWANGRVLPPRSRDV